MKQIFHDNDKLQLAHLEAGIHAVLGDINDLRRLNSFVLLIGKPRHTFPEARYCCAAPAVDRRQARKFMMTPVLSQMGSARSTYNGAISSGPGSVAGSSPG